MPFTPVEELPSNPAVRIFFSGQMILEPSLDKKTCEVFVSRVAPDHHLSIEVRRKQAGKPDIIMMRHLGPLSFAESPAGAPPKHGVFIRVTNGPKGVRGYDGTNVSSEGKSLKHAINMNTIHDVPTGPVDRPCGRPSIYIDDAVFYAADTILSAVIKKKKGGGIGKPLSDIATIIGANVYLTGNSKVSLAWRQNGRDVKLDLEKSAAFSYEIYIDNDPLYEDDALTAPFTHDEFAEYYKMLPGIPPDEQFALTFPSLSRDRGTTRTPCMSVLLNE